jgi:quinol monooxygenase YgiN
MSVLVTMKVSGDTEQFRRFIADEERLRAISDTARAAGCLAHRFGVGDGFIRVVDEWESADAFQRFITSPEMAVVFQEAGAQGEPEVEFSEAIETADQF